MELPAEPQTDVSQMRCFFFHLPASGVSSQDGVQTLSCVAVAVLILRSPVHLLLLDLSTKISHFCTPRTGTWFSTALSVRHQLDCSPQGSGWCGYKEGPIPQNGGWPGDLMLYPGQQSCLQTAVTLQKRGNGNKLSVFAKTRLPPTKSRVSQNSAHDQTGNTGGRGKGSSYSSHSGS